MTYIISFLLNIILSAIDVALMKVINAIVKNANEWTYTDIKDNWISLDNYNSLDSAASSISTLLIPIGCGLVIVFFFLELINQLAKDNLSSYTLLKSGVQLIFAYGIVVYSYELCTSISEIGIWFANKVSSAVTANLGKIPSPEVSSFIIGSDLIGVNLVDPEGDWVPSITNLMGFDMSKDDGLINMILHGVSSLILQPAYAAKNAALLILEVIGVLLAVLYWVGMGIIHLILILQCVSRAIQVAIYSAMAPIGIAAWFSGGSITTSTAMRYVKKLIALAIQGGIMILILLLSSSISAGTDSLFLTLVGPLTAVGLFSKSNQIANDVCGT